MSYEKIAADLANPLVLKFDKIGTFTGRRNQTTVLFANLCDDINKQRLMRLAGSYTDFSIRVYSVVIWFSLETVKSTFEEYLVLPDDRPFNPHLTIAKLSRDFPNINSINPYLYRKYNDLVFGTEVVQGIELLAMSRLADEEDGYYKVFAKHP